ncbi:hypothetical protein PG991_012140 [Apiospora marii]|uniref:Uncharacterized protein n=1 Tax=Apiospora marii TaxID=335849 RepID=A0ABR1RAT5_9PEZI
MRMKKCLVVDVAKVDGIDEVPSRIAHMCRDGDASELWSSPVFLEMNVVARRAVTTQVDRWILWVIQVPRDHDTTEGGWVEYQTGVRMLVVDTVQDLAVDTWTSCTGFLERERQLDLVPGEDLKEGRFPSDIDNASGGWFIAGSGTQISIWMAIVVGLKLKTQHEIVGLIEAARHGVLQQ